jgi:hypothetical protein
MGGAQCLRLCAWYNETYAEFQEGCSTPEVITIELGVLVGRKRFQQFIQH